MYSARYLRQHLSLLAAIGASALTGSVRASDGGPVTGATILLPDVYRGTIADGTGVFRTVRTRRIVLVR